MKHKFIAASLLMALSLPVLAADDMPTRGSRVMQRLDTNGDGVISLDEFKFPGTRMLKRADINGDGAVTLDEMHQHHAQRMAEREARMKQHMADQQARMDAMFKSMDTNGDGAVTPDEARAAAFKRLDANGDGVISADEFAKAGPRHGHRGDFRGPGGPGPDGDFPPPPKD